MVERSADRDCVRDGAVAESLKLLDIETLFGASAEDLAGERVAGKPTTADEAAALTADGDIIANNDHLDAARLLVAAECERSTGLFGSETEVEAVARVSGAR